MNYGKIKVFGFTYTRADLEIAKRLAALSRIIKAIQNLRDLPIWKDRSMAATIFGGKQNYDFWKTIFQTSKTPDGTQVLANSINIVEMIKK